jgi:flagellar M-ring protein FliF
VDFLNSLKQTWNALSAPQRAMSLLVLLVSVGVLAAVSYFGNRVEYRSLAVGDPAKIGEVATLLESAGIKPKITGNSIQVPVDRFDDAVLSIARQGLNTDGLGFELLDKSTNAFTTSLLEKVNVQRAVAGELERILRGYPGIASARVLISQERESWKSTGKDGTASVSVSLRPGVVLAPSDVAAIQACVANAWHSLRSENVAVIANGRKLTRDAGEGSDRSFAAANHQLTSQIEFEESLQRKAQNALDRAQGSGKTYVTVSAELDFDSKTEKKYVVDNEKVAPRREETRESSKGASEASNTGSVGVSSNTPADASNTPKSGESSRDTDKTTTVENAFSYDDTVTEKRGFSVKRLSVALFVDQSIKTRLPELEKVVKAAVGFDAQRADQFSATSESEFQKPIEEEKAPAPVSGTGTFELISTGGRVGALIALAALFLYLVRRANRAPREQTITLHPASGAVAGGASGSSSAAGISAGDGGARPAMTGPMGGMVAAGSDRSPEELARAAIATIAATAAAADPAAAGRVVRSWLEEKRTR